VLGKPVISFGRHNVYNIIPHVRVIEREEDLASALRWALSDDFDTDQARIDGERYMTALRSHCYAMNDFGFHNPKGYTQQSILDASDQLLASLEVKASHARRESSDILIAS